MSPAEDKNAGASSQGLSPAAIAGIVLGILALLIGGGVAVAYPALQGMLP